MARKNAGASHTHAPEAPREARAATGASPEKLAGQAGQAGRASETRKTTPAQHTHVHPHQQRESVVGRLKRAEGHLAAVRRMVEDGRDCPDILLQIAAVRAALDATARVVLADHVESCLHDASHNGNSEATWNDLRRALESFIR